MKHTQTWIVRGTEIAWQLAATVSVTAVAAVVTLLIAWGVQSVTGSWPAVATAALVGPWGWLLIWTARKGKVERREPGRYWLLALYCFLSLFAYPAAMIASEYRKGVFSQAISLSIALLAGLLAWYCWWIKDVSVETVAIDIATEIQRLFPTRGLAYTLLRFGAFYWFTVFVFALLFHLLGSADSNAFAPASPRFVECLYLSSLTISTIGFADLSPASHAARFLAIVEVFIGIVLVTTYLAAAVAHFHSREEE